MNTDTETRTEVHTVATPSATPSATGSQSGPVAVPAAPAAPAGPPSVHVRAVITWLAIFPLVAIGMMLIAPIRRVVASGAPRLRAHPRGGAARGVPRGAAAHARLRRASSPRPAFGGARLIPRSGRPLAFAQADTLSRSRPSAQTGGPHADRPGHAGSEPSHRIPKARSRTVRHAPSSSCMAWATPTRARSCSSGPSPSSSAWTGSRAIRSSGADEQPRCHDPRLDLAGAVADDHRDGAVPEAAGSR